MEKVHKVEQVVTSKQFTHTGHSFLIETGDPDADAVSFLAFSCHIKCVYFWCDNDEVRTLFSAWKVCGNPSLNFQIMFMLKAIMKALEDARNEDPNVQVAEVTITKQETEDDD